MEIDSRTSDAIAIALRTNMPIYMLRSVVQEAGFEASQLTPSGKEEKPRTLEEMSDAELAAAGVSPDLVRFSVGIEDVEDLIADLEKALERV